MEEDQRVRVGEELAELLPVAIAKLEKELAEKEELELRLQVLTGKVFMWNPGIAISTTVSTTSEYSNDDLSGSEEDEEDEEANWLLQNDATESTDDSADVDEWLRENDDPTHTFNAGERLFGNFSSSWAPCTITSTTDVPRTYNVARASDGMSFTLSEDSLRVAPPHNHIERSSIRPVGITTRTYEAPNFETFEQKPET
eukprot:TRINITY_DN17957_c0_g1_i1.p1 TRINITY_DN17957_c0_g1~~TRINITY_DN17957_c0_g1_i1.p1  ORF type:complete len:199 (+),score=47.85 TRINITY_DN17957_c0_g1_i1:206-802(+)